MNIPARYCTGYLGDIGVPPPYGAMDFAGWFEVYLGGHWYTFDARNNTPRIGRVLMARGRDAVGCCRSAPLSGRTPSRVFVSGDSSRGSVLRARRVALDVGYQLRGLQ